MIMNIEDIRKKLPDELAKRITDENLLIEDWSDEWYSNAKDIIYNLNLVRDDGLISKEEYSFIFDRYFRKWGIGIIGSNPDVDYKYVFKSLEG